MNSVEYGRRIAKKLNVLISAPLGVLTRLWNGTIWTRLLSEAFVDARDRRFRPFQVGVKW